VSGEIITFLFLRTLTDSGLSEVEASGSFSFSMFSKITSHNTLRLWRTSEKWTRLGEASEVVNRKWMGPYLQDLFAVVCLFEKSGMYFYCCHYVKIKMNKNSVCSLEWNLSNNLQPFSVNYRWISTIIQNLKKEKFFFFYFNKPNRHVSYHQYL
jgi:hypothetical protein